MSTHLHCVRKMLTHWATDLKLYVDGLESVCIPRKLLAEVVAPFENALQVGPGPLDLHPCQQDRVSNGQLFLQFHHLEQEMMYVFALEDALELNLERKTTGIFFCRLTLYFSAENL